MRANIINRHPGVYLRSLSVIRYKESSSCITSMKMIYFYHRVRTRIQPACGFLICSFWRKILSNYLLIDSHGTWKCKFWKISKKNNVNCKRRNSGTIFQESVFIIYKGRMKRYRKRNADRMRTAILSKCYDKVVRWKSRPIWMSGRLHSIMRIGMSLICLDKYFDGPYKSF